MSKEPITAENWGSGPHNRWSFQHVQALFPTTRIRRGRGPISELPVSQREISDITYAGLGGQQRTIGQMLDDTYTDAFLVMKDGMVISESYDNGMGPDSHHLLNSVSKSFVGMLAGILVDDGLLDPATKVSVYVPEFAQTAFADTTLQNALDMTAAVSFGEDYDDPRADFWVETAVVGWRPALVSDQLPESLFDYAMSLQATEQKEGEHFHYRTVLTNIVAMVIERASGQRVQDLIEQRIWQHLGPEQDAAIVVDRAGFPYTGAGMNACARDLARFGQMLLQNGEYNGTQIVPRAWVENTRDGSQDLRRLFSETDYEGLMPGGHYQNQVWAQAALATMLCIGIYGQTIYIDQPAGVVIVKLSTHPRPVDNALFGDTFVAMRALATAL